MQGSSNSERQSGAYSESAVCALAIPQKAVYVQGVAREGSHHALASVPCGRTVVAVDMICLNPCINREVLQVFSSEAETFARASEGCIVNTAYAGAQ